MDWLVACLVDAGLGECVCGSLGCVVWLAAAACAMADRWCQLLWLDGA